MRSWLEPKIQKWVAAIKVMGHAAKRYPQTAYAGMTRSLMCEWQYLQRVLPGVSDAFEPIEEALRCHFLPQLLGQATVSDRLRERLKQPVNKGGLGIPNPSETSDALFEAYKRMILVLTASLIKNKSVFSTEHYFLESRAEQIKCRAERQDAQEEALQKYLSTSTDKEAR